jgi:phasin family protein
MSAKSPRAAPAREAGRKELASWNFLADLGRQQLSVATDASCAIFRGFEAIRKIQEQVAHDISARHQAIAQKLHGARQPADLIAMQAALVRDDLESATQYWQQVAASALETQTEMMGCASHLLDSDTALETVSALEAFDMVPGMNSLFALKPNA